VPVLNYCLGWVRRLRGQLVEGAELLDGAIESARVSGNAQSLAGYLLNRSLIALAAGDLEMALTSAEESVDLTGRLDQGLAAASAGLALAAALLETGEPARAVDVLCRPSGGHELALIPGAWRANWLELLTRCWLGMGRLDEATRAAALSRECAAAFGYRLAAALADRAEAVVALAAGEPARAAELALASAVAADEVGARIEGGLSRALAGRALAQAGRRERGVAELQRAAAELDDCGALGHRDAAERELRALGHHVRRRLRPGRAGAEGIDSLSEREMQVARLIVERNTNPEIAAALFLSPKTVETHVRNIFRKLSVSSRVQVARVVERADARSPVRQA
jgi:ATP/maltotriose-dependent transcriptional regulator MalT